MNDDLVQAEFEPVARNGDGTFNFNPTLLKLRRANTAMHNKVYPSFQMGMYEPEIKVATAQGTTVASTTFGTVPVGKIWRVRGWSLCYWTAGTIATTSYLSLEIGSAYTIGLDIVGLYGVNTNTLPITRSEMFPKGQITMKAGDTINTSCSGTGGVYWARLYYTEEDVF